MTTAAASRRRVKTLPLEVLDLEDLVAAHLLLDHPQEAETESILANCYATGNGQAFASAVDALPGANHYDPYSTGIGLGDGQYWSA